MNPSFVFAVCGGLVGLGLSISLTRIIPAGPDAAAAVRRMSGRDRLPAPEVLPADADLAARLGAWLQRRVHVPAVKGISPSRADLDLVGKRSSALLGEKAAAALGGLVVVPLVVAIFTLFGLGLPVTAPALVGLVLAAGGWFVPDLVVKQNADRARAEFARSVSAYLELLAMERGAGAGAVQAIEGAARVATTWPFQRISQALERARYAGKPAWGALRDLSEELSVPELAEVADIMRIASTEDGAVYDQLRARAASMRDAQLNIELERANADSTRMTIPMTFTGLVFLALLVYPFLTQLWGG